jgi:tetratricopeptide (TPR) repeat protein
LFFQASFTEAVPYLRGALELQPDLWRIQALLGIAEKRTGDTSSAQNHLEAAFPRLDDKKVQLETGLELIELYSASAQLDKALSMAAMLQDLAPENPRILFVVYHISRRMMDQSLLSMMMVAPDSAEMHMMMAGELARQRDEAKAIAQYRETIRVNPELPGAHFELGEQLRNSADPALNDQAEAEYKAAIQVNEYDSKAWRQLAAIKASKGNFQAAEEDYRKALTLQPRDSDAKTGLAIALISLNRTDEAISLLESALQGDPTNVAAHYRLSLVYRRAGRMSDADREIEAFHHFQDERDRLDEILKHLGGAVREK